MFRSLPERDAQRVAAALEGLKRSRQRKRTPTGDDAERFLETSAGPMRVLYRIDKRALKVALLRQCNHARVREFPT